MTRTIGRQALCLAATMIVAASAVSPGAAASAATGTSAPQVATAGIMDPPPPHKVAPPPHLDPWIPPVCVDAEFTATYADPPLGLRVFGTMTRCETYVPDSKFAVVAYRPGQVPVVYTSQLQRYLADRPTIGFDFVVRDLPIADGVAVCALSTRFSRVGCAQLVNGPDGAVVPEPIPVDHPLVQSTVNVVYDGTPDLPDPGCANCV